MSAPATMPKPVKLLALCDSPTVPTGFGKVSNQILGRFAQFGATVDVWAINFNGHGYRKAPWATLYPAGEPWADPKNLGLFLKQLAGGGYTHVWIMQDSWMLALHEFPKVLREVCQARGIRSMFYFPVDADWEPDWSAMIAAVDCPVAYTEYGRRVALDALAAHRASLQMDQTMELALEEKTEDGRRRPEDGGRRPDF